MELKPIRTKKDHQAALAEASRLWDAPAKSPDADREPVVQDSGVAVLPSAIAAIHR